MLYGKRVELLALGSFKPTVPLPKVYLECEGLEGILKFGVLNCIPAEILVGSNVLTMSKALKIVTCSKSECCSVVPERNCKDRETAQGKGTSLA